MSFADLPRSSYDRARFRVPQSPPNLSNDEVLAVRFGFVWALNRDVASYLRHFREFKVERVVRLEASRLAYNDIHPYHVNLLANPPNERGQRSG
jgi:hypothetical protein